MATISTFKVDARGMGNPGRKPYMVQTTIDFGHADLDALSAGDIVEAISVPANTMVLTAGAEMIESVQSGADGNTVNLGFTASGTAIGGTAVGTGINAPDNFGKDVAKEISKSLGINFVEVENHFTRQGSREEVVHLSGCLKAFAVSMFKIANDIRWMGS